MWVVDSSYSPSAGKYLVFVTDSSPVLRCGKIAAFDNCSLVEPLESVPAYKIAQRTARFGGSGCRRLPV